MELWDLYDSQRRPTGETMVRGDPVPEGRYHLVVHVCIFNAAGQMLIQHRQPFKQGWSNLWDITVGGSAVQGDSSRNAAEREVAEEIGYHLDLSDVPMSMSITYPDCFDDFYIVEREMDISSLQLQYEEVKEVKWAAKEDIFAMIDNGTFIPYHKAFIDFLFFRHRNSGTRFSAVSSV